MAESRLETTELKSREGKALSSLFRKIFISNSHLQPELRTTGLSFLPATPAQLPEPLLSLWKAVGIAHSVCHKDTSFWEAGWLEVKLDKEEF